jgi:hypothetical protein
VRRHPVRNKEQEHETHTGPYRHRCAGGVYRAVGYGGGIVLLAGTYKDGVLIEAGGRGQFPLEWLLNTPFSDYTIPALILAIGVGGSSLLAVVMVFTGRAVGVLASIVAGLIMAGYIVVEVVMLRQGYPGLRACTLGLVC